MLLCWTGLSISSSWAETSTLLPPNAPSRGSVVVSKWTQDQKLSSGFMLLTFMTTHLFHVSFASACGHGKDQTCSTGTVLFFHSFVLYRPWIPAEHPRGICAVECVTAHLRGFEEDSRSEVVFCIDEWSIEFGYHWLMLLMFLTAHLFQFCNHAGFRADNNNVYLSSKELDEKVARLHIPAYVQADCTNSCTCSTPSATFHRHPHLLAHASCSLFHSQVRPHTPGSRGVGTPGVIWHH